MALLALPAATRTFLILPSWWTYISPKGSGLRRGITILMIGRNASTIACEFYQMHAYAHGKIKTLNDKPRKKVLGKCLVCLPVLDFLLCFQAIIHPDTGKKVLMPFRMSGYVPFGTVTVVGMLLPAPSLRTVIFWQWMNQSHNAAVNYSNRNASKPTPTSRFVLSYFGAVTSAVTIALGLTTLVKRAKISNSSVKALLQRLVAYPATATANICNVVLMRNHELFTGIEVKDKDGNVVGTSNIAARKAVFETTLTRILLPLPVLVIPPFAMQLLERTKFMVSRPRLHLPVQALVCVAAFGFGLPLAIALFPQTSEVSPSDLEPEIQMVTKERKLFYNKGL